MRNISLFVVFLFIGSKSVAQHVTVDSKYHSPLGIPLQLSAIFGDIRPNHFHMGLDFKTNQREGIPIHSISDGYISRIRISPIGYGRVVYIDHPNGITSVYAHCSTFSEKITDFLEPFQVEAFSNNIDLKLRENELIVQKGELIALSGNSGSSTGPHLHFEIRDTKTEHGLNPLLHGFNIIDNSTPVIQALKIYAVDDKGYQIPGKSMIINVQKTKNGYSIPGNKIILTKDFIPDYGQLAFAVSGSDPIGLAGNFGLFENICIIGNDTLFQSKYNRISFDDSRYVNSHQDLDEYKKSKLRFHKLFKTAHNPLHIYQFEQIGSIKVNPKDSLNVEIILKDVSKNSSTLRFSVVCPRETASKSERFYSSKTHFIPDSSYHFKSEQMEIDIEPFTFYEPIKKIKAIENNRFGNNEITIQKAFKVTMQPIKNINIELKNQYIQVVSNGKSTPLFTKIENQKLTAESKVFGQFYVKIDTIAPKIFPENFKESDTLIHGKKLIWKVLESQTDIFNYNILVNGEWKQLEYDLKTNRLIYFRKDKTIKTAIIEILVSDNCENIGSWKKILYFE
ncbi:MAG: M23 family metallopeptidase [Bacteroidetes bacterium]|nr:M23 family metallopeptidase [Bacteroidota bacterium]